MKATNQQVRTLSLLCLILLCAVFWPGVKLAVSSAVRDPVVRNKKIEIVVYRTWSALRSESSIAAFTHCWTTLCSKVRSSMEIRVQETFVGQEDAWLRHTEKTLKERRTYATVVSTLESRAGTIKCVEPRGGTGTDVAESLCIGIGSGLVAAFQGVGPDLKAFHSMLASLKFVS
jgi:hypothetical protein